MKRTLLFSVVFGTVVSLSATAQAQSFYDSLFAFSGAGNSSSKDYALLTRPLTLSEGTFEIQGTLNHMRMSFSDGPFSFTASATTLSVSAAYGITDSIEVGLETGLVLDPEFDWTEILAPRAVIGVIGSDTFDLAVDLVLPINLGDGDALGIVFLGAPMRLKITEQFAVMTGHNAIMFGFGDLADYAIIAGNVGVAYQVNDMVGLRADTQLFTIGLGDADGFSTFDEYIPLSLSGVISLEILDIHAGLTFPDLGVGTDLLLFNLGAAFRI